MDQKQDRTAVNEPVNLSEKELIDLIATGDLEMPVTFKRSFKDTDIYKRFLCRFSPTERRSILSGDYRELLLDCNREAGMLSFKVSGNHSLPQNWNGNTYHGAPAVVLSTFLEQHPDATPVFLTTEQVVDMGLNVPRGGGIRVVHKEGIASLPIASRVYNLDETDYRERFPLHYREIRKALSEADQAFREKSSVSDLEIKEAVSSAAEQLGITTNAPKEFAALALYRRASRTSIRLPRVLEATVEGDKAYGLVFAAGKIELAAEKTLGLTRGHMLDMDDIVRSVNKKLQKAIVSKTAQTESAGMKI